MWRVVWCAGALVLASCATEGGEQSGGGEGYEGGEGNEGGDDGGGGETGIISGTCDASNEDCGPGTCGGEGSTMLPGADCLSCHTGGEPGRFTVGGTVFTDLDGTEQASGVTVTIRDANDDVVSLESNRVGNFYSSASFAFPITASVGANGATLEMASAVSTAACNSCHQCDGAAGGKLHAP